MNFSQYAQAETDKHELLVKKTAELIMASPTRRPSLTLETVIDALNEMDTDELGATHKEYFEKMTATTTPTHQPVTIIHEKTAYHGSDVSIDEVDFGMSAHFGFHLGSKAQAKMFGDKLHEVTFKYSKLLRLDDLGTWSTQSIISSLKALGHIGTEKADAIYKEDNEVKQDKMLRDAIVEAGFDAIVYKNQVERKNTDSFIIINENSIASIREIPKRKPSLRA